MRHVRQRIVRRLPLPIVVCAGHWQPEEQAKGQHELTKRNQPWRTAPLCAFLIALVIGFASVETAQAGTISIEWDRSPDPTVVGYRVSVGTSPGVYTETFDVGSATTFVYIASESRPYYLAVASYAAGPQVGPLSTPISAVPFGTSPAPAPGVSWPDAQSFYQALWRDVATASSAGSRFTLAEATGTTTRAPSTVCWTPSSECLAVRTLARSHAEITSLTVSPGNRLYFIEGNQRIRVIASNALQSRPVLVADSPAAQLNQLALDSAFAVTGLMYVGETVPLPDGSREFHIARYRVVQDQAAARSVIFSTPLPSPGTALFAVASSGHIYVSVPGVVLRLNVDGTIPFDQRGSPVYATGYATPTAVALDERTQRLWLAGLDDHGQASVSVLGGPSSPALMPVTSMSTGTDGTGADYLYLASAAGSVAKAAIGAGHTISASWQLTIDGMVRDVAATLSGDVFVAVESQASAGGPATSILRLTPAR